jgi:delta-aminolevulinic acid dehydratase/porphobilinogen synthase
MRKQYKRTDAALDPYSSDGHDGIVVNGEIVLGVNLAVNRLIERKIQTDGELAYSENGKVVLIKARELKK